MPRPQDLTPEQARAEGERLRERSEAADREDAPLLAKQLAEGEVHPTNAPEGCTDPDGAGRWTHEYVSRGEKRWHLLSAHLVRSVAQHLEDCDACLRLYGIYIDVGSALCSCHTPESLHRLLHEELPADLRENALRAQGVDSSCDSIEREHLFEKWLTGSSMSPSDREALFEHLRMCAACLLHVKDLLGADAIIEELWRAIPKEG